MIYELSDTTKVAALFADCEDTLTRSCLQRVMGKIYVTDSENPESAFVFVGCFGFFMGKPDRELVAGKPDGYCIFVPEDTEWEKLIEEVYPEANRITRYAIRKDTVFDREKLRGFAAALPGGYEIKRIDSALYDECLASPPFCDFVSSFESKERFFELGRGYVVVKEGRIVAGASSYSRYKEGIEIEVDTLPEERQKGLATAASASLILSCLDDGLYPSWDAANLISVHLAEKLGYRLANEYTAYEVS